METGDAVLEIHPVMAMAFKAESCAFVGLQTFDDSGAVQQHACTTYWPRLQVCLHGLDVASTRLVFVKA